MITSRSCFPFRLSRKPTTNRAAGGDQGGRATGQSQGSGREMTPAFEFHNKHKDTGLFIVFFRGSW